MNREEFCKLTEEHLVSVSDLNEKSDRTLIYGYTLNGDTFHVYIKNEKIYAIIYNTDDENNRPINVNMIDVDTNNDYIPSKRIYPEASDYEFCKLLMNYACYLAFTGFDEGREKKQYHGFTLEDIGIWQIK